MTALVIKKLSAVNWLEFKRLREKCYAEEAAYFPWEPADKYPTPESYQRVLQLMDRVFYGAFIDNQMIGRVGIKLLPDQPQTAEIIGYYILPEYRGCGFGHYLNAFILGVAYARTDINKIYIWHRTSNQSSAACIKRMGFKLTGEQLNVHWHDNTYGPALTYELALVK